MEIVQIKYPKSELFEKLADIEHQRWADWQSYCHRILRNNIHSEELEGVLKRWDRQIATSYSNLSEEEKDSDRNQVMRYWSLISSIEEKLEKIINPLTKGEENK